MIESHFDLVDYDGQPVTEQHFRGQWLLVYFGFSHCKVICPRSLAKLSAALDALGADAARITALCITIDPARDTPLAMKQWLSSDYPNFIGLTGSSIQIEEAKAAFRVFAERKPDADAPDGYTIPHTAIAYLIDPAGHYRMHFLDSVDGKTITDRIRDIISNEEIASHA